MLLLGVDGTVLVLWIIVAAIGGAIFSWLLIAQLTGGTISRARKEAERRLETAEREAESIRGKSELDAERFVRQQREAFDKEQSAAKADFKKAEKRLASRQDKLDSKLDRLSSKENKLDQRHESLLSKETAHEEAIVSLQKERDQIRARLAEVGSLTEEAAREQLLEEVRQYAEHDARELSQRILDEAETDARGKSREITLMAIQRYAAEHVADSTVRSVRIASDDLKGRVIGREGRNIRALERATGADILVDDTPGVISVSCFDPVRRAIAGEALAKLVEDGRVHPSRIEEVVASVRADMQERIKTYGSDAVMETSIRGLHPKIVEALGKMHFRTSYGQNVLRHSIEVAFLSQIIADQLGLDGDIGRRCGLLHDIGKAMDHEMEGTHPVIGAEFCRRHGEKTEAVLNAVAGHHGDIPATTPYTPIVMAADAISGARPGARRESMEMYVKRLEQLESLAREHETVTEAHAIQAGREVRVIVDAKKADDALAFDIASKIAKRVEEEMTFPGEIKVTVLREVRAEATAR